MCLTSHAQTKIKWQTQLENEHRWSNTGSQEEETYLHDGFQYTFIVHNPSNISASLTWRNSIFNIGKSPILCSSLPLATWHLLNVACTATIYNYTAPACPVSLFPLLSITYSLLVLWRELDITHHPLHTCLCHTWCLYQGKLWGTKTLLSLTEHQPNRERGRQDSSQEVCSGGKEPSSGAWWRKEEGPDRMFKRSVR